MKRLVLFIVPIFFAAFCEAGDETGSLKREAERFASESRFLLKHTRTESALEKAETAVALAPENKATRAHLVHALIAQASAVLRARKESERWIFFGETQWEQALRGAERARELMETLPDDDFEAAYRAGSVYQFGHRRDANLPMTYLRGTLTSLASDRFPARRNEIQSLNARILEHWLKNRYRPVRDRADDPPSCRKYCAILREGCYDVLKFQDLRAQGRFYREAASDLLNISKAQGFETIRSANEPWYDIASCLIDNLCLLMRDSANSDDDRESEQARRFLDETARLLEDDPRAVFRHFGWIVRHNPGFIWKHDFQHGIYDQATRKSARKYFAELIRHLESLPPEKNGLETQPLYSSLGVTAPYCRESDKYLDRLPFLLETIETANRREEVAYRAAGSFLFCLRESSEKKVPTEIRDSRAKYSEVVFKQIKLLGTVDPVAAESLRKRALAARLDIPEGGDPKPWCEEVVLFNGTSQRDIPYCPLIRRDKLYFFSQAGSDLIRLSTVDLKTLDLVHGEAVEGRGPRNDAYIRNVNGSVFVDDRNAYFGTIAEGLLVFPLDDSPPWSFTERDGLPTGTVHSVGSLNGTPYLGLGDEKTGSWLVKLDLESKSCEILSASSAREGKAPFFNQSPPPRFDYFFEDVKRNRLLILVTSRGPYRGVGLWKLDGKTGNYSKFPYRTNISHKGRLLSDGDRFLLLDGWENRIIGLDDRHSDDLDVLLTVRGAPADSKRFQQAKIKSCFFYDATLFDGFFWGRFILDPHTRSVRHAVWGRVADRNGAEFERLRIPTVIESVQWEP